MHIDKKQIINFILAAIIVYLAIGFWFALYAWSAKLKTFTCIAPNEPHQTIGRGGMWHNPDPERCARRGLELHSIATVPYFTVAWPVFLGGKIINTNQHAPEPQPHETTKRPSLTDSTETYVGIYHESAVKNGLKSFSSIELGMSLQYPDDHLLFSSERSITIAPREAMLQSIVRARSGTGGEGPPGIRFTFFEMVDPSLSLEEWVRTSSQSNWKLALPSWEDRENTLTPTTVASAPAFAYHNDGLYSYDYVAFKHGDWVVLASGASTSNTPNPDFQTVLDSMQLRN